MLRLYIDYKQKHKMNVFIEARERADLLANHKVMNNSNAFYVDEAKWRERKAVSVSETVKK